VNLCGRLGAICIGTEWRGLSERDRPDALRVATDLSRFPLLTDKLIQGVANTLALGRLVSTSFADEPFLEASGGGSLVDPDRRYYFGISLGGIEGAVFLAKSQVVDTGVLHVPASVWSTTLERSSNWAPLEAFVVETLPDPGDRQLLYAISQLLWDPVDPINHLSGLNTKNGLWQVAMGDEQVPNFTAEILARSLGLPLVTPAVESVFGLDEREAPLGPGASAYFQFDPVLGRPPPHNRPAEETGAHQAIRHSEEVKLQVEAFLEAGAEGTVIHPCDGPCVLDEVR
jgi:hypothetical protein